MAKNTHSKVTVIIPARNSETTIEQTILSLNKQSKYFGELIIVDNASTDNTLKIIKQTVEKINTNILVTIINHPKDKGLSESYNEAIKISKGTIIVTLHSDILLEKDALVLLTKPLLENSNVLATTHQVIHPLKIWLNYNFWQKSLFSRHLGKTLSGMDGKFDGFNKKAIIEVGLFDSTSFRTAGEDSDIVNRLKKIGEIIYTKATIVHMHTYSKNFNLNDLIYKHAQYAEAQGTLLRKHGPVGFKYILIVYFREILILSLLIPYFRIISLVLILIYSFLYTKNTYIYEHKNPRIIILPFVNVFLLFVSLIFTIRGYLRNKQTI